jgi:hypothetical protein
LGSSHDQGRIVRLGIGFWLRFGPLAVFRYEFSGLIRAHGATSLLDLPETRSGMSIPVRVLLGDDVRGTPTVALVLFSVRNGRCEGFVPDNFPGIIRSSQFSVSLYMQSLFNLSRVQH